MPSRTISNAPTALPPRQTRHQQFRASNAVPPSLANLAEYGENIYDAARGAKK